MRCRVESGAPSGGPTSSRHSTFFPVHPCKEMLAKTCSKKALIPPGLCRKCSSKNASTKAICPACAFFYFQDFSTLFDPTCCLTDDVEQLRYFCMQILSAMGNLPTVLVLQRTYGRASTPPSADLHGSSGTHINQVVYRSKHPHRKFTRGPVVELQTHLPKSLSPCLPYVVVVFPQEKWNSLSIPSMPQSPLPPATCVKAGALSCAFLPPFFTPDARCALFPL